MPWQALLTACRGHGLQTLLAVLRPCPEAVSTGPAQGRRSLYYFPNGADIGSASCYIGCCFHKFTFNQRRPAVGRRGGKQRCAR